MVWLSLEAPIDMIAVASVNAAGPYRCHCT